jgi:hypothetical protein
MYRTKAQFKSENTAAFTPGVKKWTGLEVQGGFGNAADSVFWIDQKVVMSALNYDCSLGSLQEKTLTGNSTLTISNAVAGMYYTLIKKGAFTLTLPSGQFTGSTSVVPSGTAVVTFLYDGTNYYFNFASYLST